MSAVTFPGRIGGYAVQRYDRLEQTTAMPGSADPPEHEITRLLREWKDGNQNVQSDLLTAVYEDLRQMARRHMRREAPGHTLQTTALVHEAYLRLFGREIDWQSRSHFYAIAGQMMRRILVDHARGRRTAKRDGGARVDLDDVALVSEEQLENVIAVDEALTKLRARDPRQAQLVELHLFAGLTLQETSDVLKVSRRTVQRDWNFLQAWLYQQMTRPDSNRKQEGVGSSR
jgi:RNA polymerase sigma factor (TIGR02999 family)